MKINRNNSIKFSYQYKLPIPVLKTSKDITSSVLNIQDNISFQCILYNLYKAYKISLNKKEDIFVSVSLNRDYYNGTSRYVAKGLSYTYIKRSIDFLNKYKLIYLHKGYHFSDDARRTAIIASPLLVDIFKRNENHPVYLKPNFFVIIKDKNKEGCQVPHSHSKMYEEHLKIERINNELIKHTYSLSKKVDTEYSFDFQNISSDSAQLIRHFSDSKMKINGRFTNTFQQIRKVDRRYITIDGEECCEIDFANTFPTICYAKIGKELDRDAYCMPGFQREIVKKMLNIMLNCKDDNSAVAAMIFETKDRGAANYYRTLISSIKKEHQEISHFFYSDMWKWAMKDESDIAYSVIKHFTTTLKEGIIPIHDSFIVKARYAEDLERTMKESFYKKFKQTPKTKREF